MHIGLVGSIGVSATIGYYTRLVEVFKEAEKPLELTIVHADVQTLAMNAQAGLLAGTDLGLAFDGQDLDYAVIDALEAHVAGLLQSAM